MPISKSRKNKPAYTPPPTANPKSAKFGNPAWLAPAMVSMFILGLFWIVVFYITNGNAPLMHHAPITNILIGFGFIGVGFGFATRWK